MKVCLSILPLSWTTSAPGRAACQSPALQRSHTSIVARRLLSQPSTLNLSASLETRSISPSAVILKGIYPIFQSWPATCTHSPPPRLVGSVMPAPCLTRSLADFSHLRHLDMPHCTFQLVFCLLGWTTPHTLRRIQCKQEALRHLHRHLHPCIHAHNVNHTTAATSAAVLPQIVPSDVQSRRLQTAPRLFTGPQCTHSRATHAPRDPSRTSHRRSSVFICRDASRRVACSGATPAYPATSHLLSRA